MKVITNSGTRARAAIVSFNVTDVTPEAGGTTIHSSGMAGSAVPVVALAESAAA